MKRYTPEEIETARDYIGHHADALPKADTTEVLRDRERGTIHLTIRDGVVVGAMGSEPKRFIGLTVDRARHVARYGGRS